MWLKLGLIFCYLFTATQLHAQSVRVTDKSTSTPVADVYIYHENKQFTAYTDQKGRADLSSFPNGVIFLQHPSFHQTSTFFQGEDLEPTLKEKIISYNEVIVAANKWEQDQNDISQQTLSVNKKSVVFQNPQTSADLLNASGQVFVQKSQLGGGSPKIRGFAANAVMIVVDGVRMNNAIFRSGNLQNVISIDPNALASMEVIFGPGSVIYGSDALGGVMDFHTITPKWSSEKKAGLTSNGLLRYSSAASEQTGHIDFSYSRKRFTFFHSTTFSGLGDLRAGARRSSGYKGEFERKFFVEKINNEDALAKNDDVNLQKFSGYNLFNTLSKVGLRIGNNMDITYGFYLSSTSDIPRYDNLTETTNGKDSLKNAEWYYGPQKWAMHSAKLNFYQSNPLFDQLRLTLAYQAFEETRNDRGFGDSRLRARKEKVDMVSTSLDFEKELNETDLFYGIDFYYNDIWSSAYIRNLDTQEVFATDSRYPDGGSSFYSIAVYGSLIKPLSNQFVLNAGLRFNSIGLKGSTINDRALANDSKQIDLNNTALNGSLGLVYKHNDKNRVSYNISTGFRAPNIDDVGKVFEVGNTITVPNPSLKPEYSISNELSYQYRTSPFYFKATGFYSRVVDAIVDGPFILNGNATAIVDGDTLGISSKVNTGKAVIYGGSVILTAEFANHWAISKTISYTDGRDIIHDEPLRHTTPFFGRAALTFQKKKLRSEFYIEYNSNRDRSDIPSSEIDDKPYLYTQNGTPGWVTYNWKSSFRLNDFSTLNFGIENILDQHYRPYTSGISAPGRNFIIGLRVHI